jgi:hypothetical protein
VGGDLEQRGLHGLRLKYRIGQDEPARRYQTLLFQILEAVSAATSKTLVGWSDFALDPSPQFEKLEQAVFEWSRVMANLAAIDGAVVIDKRFSLIGFGAEVSADLPAPERVFRAADDPFNDGIVENRRVETSFNVCRPQGFEISFCSGGFGCTSN